MSVFLTAYKTAIVKCDNYIINDGQINFKNFQILLNTLSLYELEKISLNAEILERKHNSKKFITISSINDIFDEKKNIFQIIIQN